MAGGGATPERRAVSTPSPRACPQPSLLAVPGSVRRLGVAVRTTGYAGAPHICAIDLAVISKMSVQIVTEGMPAFSAWIPSCTLHALHDPQLPMATTT